jgi:uncharacterized protein YidB (DUF937 family)
MSANDSLGLDDLLGGLLGGQSGGAGGLGSILDGLTGGATGGASGGKSGMLAALLPMLGSLLANGGLNKVLSGFQQQGLGATTDSWVGTGANEQVSRADVEQVIDQGEIAQIADRLGISHEEAAQAIAEVLPQLVDQASPEGVLASDEDLEGAFSQLASVGVS